MEATPARGPVTRTVTLVLVALLSAFFAWTLPRADAQPVVAAASHAHAEVKAAAGPRTAAQQALHDEMRKLWEDHVTWTRLAIVTFAAEGQPGFGPTAARLLQNQVDIGDAIKPFYGEAAGNALTALLHDHITIAVELLQAAKDGDTAAFADAKDRWYANSDDIADFLAQANPRFWPQSEMRASMRMHLDQTLAEAAHELAGDYAASVADYDVVHEHILGMADVLSNGLIGAFPKLIR
ncbi:MAG TPA: hypothetical protein VFY98_06725 [Intrasporangium sp.]|nr:hypothetical protein [Intrasporangium sp.]